MRSSPSYHNRAVIIGAGLAGFTATYEPLTRTNIHPIVLYPSNSLETVGTPVQNTD
jgi:monoamine oxidase